MVIGEKLLMKLLIVSKLMERKEWVLRELAWETGLSLTRLNKLLKELGKNYLLEYNDTKVHWNPIDNPSNLKPWGWRLIHRPLLGSTQDAARGLGPWSIVVAEYLAEARGRHGRTWKTGLGGIWATITLTVNSETARYVPVAVPVIISKALESLYSIKARIKWPNDVVINGNKIAGILIEAEAFPQYFIVYIGIGINANNDVSVEGATSIKKLIGMKPRNNLLAYIVGWLARINKIVGEKDKLIENYMHYLDTIGRRVIVETSSGIIEGIAIDVKDDGSLIVQRNGDQIPLDASMVYRLRYKD
ncbi:MAG: biotin--[acetyl-CoA-carboxylase] ligase [Desulfurococcales archaeon]|nr:biotin--[acetyl-CoA-carboxylase] ligase [Desulfurococcales archaeon]